MSKLRTVMKFISSSNSDKKNVQSSIPSSSNNNQTNDSEPDVLKLNKTSRCGFPFEPTSIAFDIVQRIVAIGTRSGFVKLYGGEFIESGIQHQTQSSVSFMCFVINQGALITYCEDTTLSFWNLRQKPPVIAFSKKLINEKASAIYLPFQEKWLYLGTEKGNIYLLNIYQNFSQSGYDIKWNNVIELSQKTHPGKVVHLSDQPLDNGKLLIGFETGLIVLWNVKAKKAEYRYNGPNDATLLSINWYFDGKQFVSSHSNGYLITWNYKSDSKPLTTVCPHYDDTDLVRVYNSIKKVYLETAKNGESMFIFSNGLPQQSSMKDAITIITKTKSKVVLEMKENIVDFLVVHSTPWVQTEEPLDASAIIVLLENNLITIDLKTDGYPIFEHHHSISLHDAPISYCDYIVDPDWKLITNILLSKDKQQNKPVQQQQQASNELPALSQMPYPISGGIKSCKAALFSYYELIVTGHEDGSVKLWESSGICLDFIYKIKTHKLFDKRRHESTTTSASSFSYESETPFKITCVHINNDYLAVAGLGGYVTLYKYLSKKCNPAEEELGDIPQLEIPFYYDYDKTQNDATASNNNNNNNLITTQTNQIPKDLKSLLRVKIGYKRQQGYQPELVCLFLWSQKPPVVNNLLINAKYSLLFIGTNESIICVDYTSRTILINVSISDYYGTQDPFQRTPRSPTKKSKAMNDVFFFDNCNPSDSNNALQFLAKQFTIDNSNYYNMQRTVEATLRSDSKSSSCTSLDNPLYQTEGVCFVAMNEYICIGNNKSEQIVTNMWLGTTFGTIFVLNINFVNNFDNTTTQITSIANNNITNNNNNNNNNTINNNNNNNNNNSNNNGNNISGNNSSNNLISTANSSTNNMLKPITLTPNGIKHFLQGQIIHISFLDSNGNSIQQKLNTNNNNLNLNASMNVNNSFSTNETSQVYAADDMKINNNKKKPLTSTRSSKLEMMNSSVQSSTNDYYDKNQFAVICSEKQIKVISLPAQNCSAKYSLDDENSNISKANVSVINNNSYLICYLNNGTLLTFNLPSLKQNSTLAIDLTSKEKEENERIAKTMTFGTKGHLFYLCTPSEIQKLVISANITHNITEMLPELFDPKVSLPVAPKAGFLKTIFSSTPLDRELLFGESSGKPSISVVKNTIETEAVKAKNELSELQKLALQRGEKLGHLEKRTEEMTMAASAFAKNASELSNKYKKKSQWFS